MFKSVIGFNFSSSGREDVDVRTLGNGKAWNIPCETQKQTKWLTEATLVDLAECEVHKCVTRHALAFSLGNVLVIFMYLFQKTEQFHKPN